jgi:hypothetical protein
MKRCPTCQRSFDDDSLSFCLDDGTPLASEGLSRSDASTLVGSAPTRSYNPARKETIPASQFHLPSGSLETPRKKRSVWPWIVVLTLLVLGVVAVVAIVLIAPSMRVSSGNDNKAPSPTPTPLVKTASPNPSPSEEVSDEPPTDKAEVLTALTALEERWTEANVKGDKVALEEILADDYVGGVDSHNKREYIDKLTPESTVKSWELQNIGVQLNGDRATVHGILREVKTTGTELYEFNDKFVWRDRRWQATGSDTTRVK